MSSTSGWVAFSGIMLFMAGMFGMIDGLVAIIADEVFFVADDQIILLDMTGWGWVHFFLGLIAMGAGLSVLSGQPWAFVVGIFLAVAHATTHLMFITVFPLWSITIIAIDVLVLYGLVVHGEEVIAPGSTGD